LVITAVVVKAASIAMAAGSVPLLVFPETPGSFMGALLVTPFCLLVAGAQFLAAFRASASASNLMSVLCFIVAGFAALAVLTTAGELVAAPGPAPWGFAWIFVLFAAAGGCAAAAGVANRQWEKVLRRPPPLGLCPACGYDLTGNVSGVCPECGGSSHG
jgi:hypothetical protein